MAQAINESNFEELAAQGKPMVLDFWATWCGPCKRIAPVIEALAEEYADQVIIGKVDIEESEDIALKYGIRNIPTVVFIKDGEVVDKLVGANPKPKYEEKIKSLLG